MPAFPAATCDSLLPLEDELEPSCPSCCRPMLHAPGYFHCPQCHFALCEDFRAQEINPGQPPNVPAANAGPRRNQLTACAPG